MQVQYFTEKLDLTAEEMSEIDRRFGKLDQFLQDFAEDLKIAKISITPDSRWGFLVSFDMQLPGHHIYAKHHDRNIMLAVGEVVDQVRRQLKKHLRKLRAE